MAAPRKRSRKPVARPVAQPVQPVADQSESAFEAGLIARGEAATANPDGTLPPGVTHEIVEDEGGRRLVRRRFSAF